MIIDGIILLRIALTLMALKFLASNLDPEFLKTAVMPLSFQDSGSLSPSHIFSISRVRISKNAAEFAYLRFSANNPYGSQHFPFLDVSKRPLPQGQMVVLHLP